MNKHHFNTKFINNEIHYITKQLIIDESLHDITVLLL